MSCVVVTWAGKLELLGISQALCVHFSRVVNCPELKPDCLGSYPGSATYELVTYHKASEFGFLIFKRVGIKGSSL